MGLAISELEGIEVDPFSPCLEIVKERQAFVPAAHVALLPTFLLQDLFLR